MSPDPRYTATGATTATAPARSPTALAAGAAGVGLRAGIALAATAGLALLMGTLVYLLDRPAGSAWLIPAAWQAATPGAWFGGAGLWLPSLVHAFSFSVFTALLLPRRAGSAAAACIAWALIDTLAEFGQHPDISPALAAAIERIFGTGPLAGPLVRYFALGGFDPTDVFAGLAGAASAFMAIVALRRFGPARRTGKNSFPEELSR